LYCSQLVTNIETLLHKIFGPTKIKFKEILFQNIRLYSGCKLAHFPSGTSDTLLLLKRLVHHKRERERERETNKTDLVKKFLPNFFQCEIKSSSTLFFSQAIIWSHARAAHIPSFSRT